MARKKIHTLIAFTGVFIIHAAYLIWQSVRVASQWAQTSSGSTISAALGRYLQSQDYLMSISYGLSIAFMVYAFSRLREGERSGTAGLIGGVTLTGLLYFGGCFLIGCCGSPMLVVYLNLFGAGFLGFTKPLVLILTISSIALGYIWMERRAKAANCACEGTA
jgi:hypothetical protein